MSAVSGSPTQIKTSTTTLAALAGTPDDGFLDGEIAYVQSVGRYFQLNRSSTVTPDNVTVLATLSGNGCWEWMPIASSVWASQAAWYIDEAAGSDQNDGATALTALASWSEFRRRVSVLNVSMTVTLLTDVTEALSGVFEASVSGLTLTIAGTIQLVLDLGSTTTFTDPVKTAGACEQGKMTSAALADFTPYIGKMLLAAGGYVAPILGATGPGVPYLPHWARSTTAVTKPANGTQVSIITLIEAPAISITVLGGLALTVNYLRFTSTTIEYTVLTSAVTNILFHGCRFDGFWRSTTRVTMTGCYCADAGNMVATETLSFYGGGSTRTFTVDSGSSFLFSGFLIQGAGLDVGGTTAAWAESSDVVVWGAAGLGVFGSAADGIRLGTGAYLNGSVIYGKTNLVGWSMNYGARAYVTTQPTITGTTELSFCGAATAIPPLAGGAGVPAASALASWANWAAAPFNSNVVNYSNGSVLSKVV